MNFVTRTRHLLTRIRLASQRFWAASVILGLGLVSSGFLVWIYVQATHHTSSHLPLIAQTSNLDSQISRAHLWLEEYLAGDSRTSSKDAFDVIHEALVLADSITARIEKEEDMIQCDLHSLYLDQAEKTKAALSEFAMIAHERAQRGRQGRAGGALDQKSDSLHAVLMGSTDSLHDLLVTEIDRRKNNLARLLWAVIAVWLILLGLIFILTRKKEENRQKVLQALAEAEEKVRTFIATADDMIYFQKSDYSVWGINRAAKRITGYSPRDFAKNRHLLCDIIHPDDCATAKELFSKGSNDRSSFELQYRLKTKDGKWRWIQSKKVVVIGENGEFAGFNCIDRDITQHKHDAEALATGSRELAERVKEQQCLYGVSQVLGKPNLSPRESFPRILELMEKAWQFSEIAKARINFKDKIYQLASFRQSQWSVISDITVFGLNAGTLEIYYVEERPPAHEGPFLKEERELIDAIAREIGNYAERRQAEEEIKHHNQFLSSILDSLTYPLYVLDAEDYSIKIANAASGADLSAGKLTCYQLTHGRDEPCSSAEHPCPLQQVKKTGKPCIVEHEHRGIDGEIRYHEVHGFPIFDKNGKVVRVIEYFSDITERRLTEKRLGELAAFPANNPNVVMSIDVNGEVLYANSACADTLRQIGLSPKNADRFLPPNISDIIARCAKSDKGILNVINELRGRSWTWSFHPVPGRNIIHCYATDITDLIRHEKEVRMLSAAVNQSSNMVCITDLHGLVEYVNPFFTQVTGYSLGAIAGQPIGIMKSGEHDREFYDDMWRTIRSGKSWTGNVKNRRRNGELYWERKTITPVHNDEGKIVNFLSVSNDITHELTTQQKLIEADRLSAIGTLAAGVAHEFKNYLGGIIGNASFALAELDKNTATDLAGETLAKIIDMGEKANDVAMSLLTYSRARPEDRQPEDLRKLIEKSIRLVEKELRNQSIEIVTHFDEAPPVEISASKIQQLLLNLLINAQHAIKAHGVITVALFSHPATIEIRVADTGIGIPKENLERIFDPFFSTKGVWGKDELIGTGIGLSICRNIARECGGDLKVESMVGIGTTFTLHLPMPESDRSTRNIMEPCHDSLEVMIFTLDKSLIGHFYPSACQQNARLLAVDSLSSLPEDLSSVVDLVICDSKFTGKLELFRAVEKFHELDVPYVMVNCGASEYELGDLHNHSIANFKEMPDLEKILALVQAERRFKTAAR
ncbi:MAG: PAS domain S-box protein [Candidatus Zixiibacteriota bacterium]|nr:MAG: PAS domain S-box protein [candidate division Zixibacteria bacterium]